MDLQAILMISLFAGPMLGLVIWAFATTRAHHSTAKTLFLQNRAVAVGIITMCLVAVTVLIAWQAYKLGWCHSGLLSPTKCNRMPDEIGGHLFTVYFSGAAYLAVICLPALLLMAIAEWMTRRKLRNSLTKDAAEPLTSKNR